MISEFTVERLLAEIKDSEAREADFRNRAETAEAKLAEAWYQGYDAGVGDAYARNNHTSTNPYWTAQLDGV